MTQVSNNPPITDQLAALLAQGKHGEVKEMLRSIVNEATKNAGKSPLLDTIRAHLAVENQLLAEYQTMLQETLENATALEGIATKAEDAKQLHTTRKHLQ